MLALTIFYFYYVFISLRINLSLCVVCLLIRLKIFIRQSSLCLCVWLLICFKVFVYKVYLFLSFLLRISPISVPSNSGHLGFHKTGAKQIFSVQIFNYSDHIRQTYHNCPISRIQIMLGLTIFYFCSVSFSLRINLSLCVVWLLILAKIHSSVFSLSLCVWLLICIKIFLCWVYLYALSRSSLLRISLISVPPNSRHLAFIKPLPHKSFPFKYFIWVTHKTKLP